MEDKLFAYLNVDAANQSKATPGQNSFTFSSKKSGFPQVWTFNEQDEVIQYSNLDDTVMGIFHSPNGKMSIMSKAYNGTEKQQFYLTSDHGRKTEVLVESLEHFHHFGGWSPDGKRIAYSSNRRGPGFFDLFVLEIETKETKKVFECDQYCNPLLWLKDGQHLLIDLPENSVDQSVFKLNIATREISKFGPQEDARYRSFALSKDGEGGYVLTDLGEETLYISKFLFENPAMLQKIRHVPGWDIEEIKLSPDEKKIVYTVNEDGVYKAFILDLITNEEKEIQEFPRGVIDSISWLNHDQFVCSVNTPTCPGDIWKYSLSADKLERVTYMSQDSDLEPLFIEPKLCYFDSFDGLQVPYFYYEKNRDANKPAVLYIHGGPSSQTRAEFNPLIQYLANQGYAVAAPNVRGSSGYGRTYESLDDVRGRMDSVKDLEWLVKDLVHTHKVNPDRVGIVGKSYGGFMVLAAITHYPDLWAAAVDIVGISSFKTFMETTGEWRRKLRGSEYGTIENDEDFFEEIAPLNHRSKINVPLLVFHGLNDTRVPVTESVQMVTAMKEHGQDVELTIFNDEGHFTDKKRNHIDMNGAIINFFEEKLT